jgi:2-C-methyl-D-erythritol 4-phosphate cytidylyltransferase
VFAAAGSGERLGAGGPKAFVRLAGRPMIEWSLLAAAAAETIEAAVIAAPPGAEDEAERSLAAAGIAGVVVAGGRTRAESVRLAIAEAATDLVAVHDAARPLVEASLFDDVVRRLAAGDADAAIAATPINDTVKQGVAARPSSGPAEPVAVAATLPRERLWAAQTPQAFRATALAAAQERATAAGELEGATDEAALIEAAGGVVILVPAPARNLKVTTAQDLATAEALLAAAGRV